MGWILVLLSFPVWLSVADFYFYADYLIPAYLRIDRRVTKITGDASDTRPFSTFSAQVLSGSRNTKASNRWMCVRACVHFHTASLNDEAVATQQCSIPELRA
jgi:hypothetical protein